MDTKDETVGKAIELDELTNTAMQIILHAGDARNYADAAFEKAMSFEYSEADELLHKATAEIAEAHGYQTDILQREMKFEAAGHVSQVPLLFIHAQDTLMTIMSEVRTTVHMIDLLKLTRKGGK